MIVREHCKELLITHYEDNRIGHILQSESLHSPNRLFQLWCHNENVNIKQDRIAEIFKDRLSSSSGEPVWIPDNPIEKMREEHV